MSGINTIYIIYKESLTWHALCETFWLWAFVGRGFMRDVENIVEIMCRLYEFEFVGYLYTILRKIFTNVMSVYEKT